MVAVGDLRVECCKYRGVICFSAIDWNFLRQRTHYLMEGLAANGLRVLFFENTGVRYPTIKDLPRIINRLKRVYRGIPPEEVPGGIEIISPLAIPLQFNRLAIYYNKQYLSSRIKKFLDKYSFHPPEVIFWTYLCTPVILELMQSCSWGVTIYDVVSDPKYIQPRLEPCEKEILRRVDFTFFASETLLEKYSKYTKNPVLFRDGFNPEILKAENHLPEIDRLPHPRFLYIGGINKKIQVEVLISLAEHFTDGSVVLVGPHSQEFKISPRENIYIFPHRKRYEELSAFLKAADVGLIPYVPDVYSGAMQPAKLNEYLVFGLPVLATATPELAKLASLWGDGFFYLINSPKDTPVAAQKALAENSETLRKKRQELAFDNTWDKRVKELLEIVIRQN